MSLPTNALATYESKGNREDLENAIYRVEATDTPFTSAVAKIKAKATTHDWQTQALAAASTANAVLEGIDAVVDAVTATVRKSNVCQISDKVAKVTGTQQVIAKAGRDDELSYQVMLKKLELKRDMEAILLNNQAKATGDDTTARTLAGVPSWIKTNEDKASDGTSIVTSDGTYTRVDGTARAFTEAQLKTVLQSTWAGGGDPGVIMLGGFNKQVMSSFVGRGTPTEDAKARKITAAVDVYDSDFGRIKIVPNRNNLRTQDALVLQLSMWAIAFLRNMETSELSKTGDNRSKQIITEYTLVSRNEKASAIVADLTTS